MERVVSGKIEIWFSFLILTDVFNVLDRVREIHVFNQLASLLASANIHVSTQELKVSKRVSSSSLFRRSVLCRLCRLSTDSGRGGSRQKRAPPLSWWPSYSLPWCGGRPAAPQLHELNPSPGRRSPHPESGRPAHRHTHTQSVPAGVEQEAELPVIRLHPWKQPPLSVHQADTEPLRPG